MIIFYYSLKSDTKSTGNLDYTPYILGTLAIVSTITGLYYHNKNKNLRLLSKTSNNKITTYYFNKNYDKLLEIYTENTIDTSIRKSIAVVRQSMVAIPNLVKKMVNVKSEEKYLKSPKILPSA